MASSPPYKKTRIESANSISTSNTASLSSSNHQNRFKFNANNVNRTNQNNVKQTSNTTSVQNTYNRNQYQAKNGYSTGAYETNVGKNGINNENYDEDLLDISDSELIRASQVVESQLKFTNNVHQTTSNALNIFSQFNSTNANNQNCLMPAPSIYPPSTNSVSNIGGTTHQQSSNYNYQLPASQYVHSDLDPVTQIEQLRDELKQIKTENMQKDGEVKILRDKLKRLEQDAQRMRTERSDLVKKLEQKQEETKKSLQKQIEFKELENQFKSQEIVELTMKYKYLESAVKKNPAIISSTPMPQQIQPVATTQSTAIQPNTNKTNLTPKTTISTKRNNSSMHESDLIMIENRRPDTDLARQSSITSMTHPQSPQANANIIRPNGHLSASPFNKNTTHVFQNTTNLTSSMNSICATNGKMNANDYFKEPARLANREPVTTPKIEIIDNSHMLKSNKKLERSCVLSTRLQKKYRLPNESDSKENIIYEITDLFAENANYLYKFNSLTCLNHRITNMNVNNLNKKLADLLEFMKNDLKSKFASCLNNNNKARQNEQQTPVNQTSSFPVSSTFSTSASLLSQSKIIERIEFVSNRLNDELIKLLTYCLNSYDNYNTSDQGTSRSTTSYSSLNVNISTTCQSSLENSSMLSSFNSLPNNSKRSNKNLTRPATNSSIIDILCLSFEICFQLFLFRLNYLLDDYEARKEKSLRLKSTFFTRINTLRHDFFLLVLNLLNSINMNKEELSKQQAHAAKANKSTPTSTKLDRACSLLATSSSASLSSYCTFKLLNSILDCFTCLLNLPNSVRLQTTSKLLATSQDDYSFAECFYLSLIDNMHNVFRKFDINRMFSSEMEDLGEYGNGVNGSKAPHGDQHQMETENVDEDEEDSCLFQLFYQKVIKYFGDVVYTFDNQKQNDEHVTSSRAVNSGTDPSQQANKQMSEQEGASEQQMEIITTIADENKSIYDAHKQTTAATTTTSNTNGRELTKSISQSEIQFELQSQQPMVSKKSSTKSSSSSSSSSTDTMMPISNNTESVSIKNNNEMSVSTNDKHDFFDSDSIQALQIELLSKFLNYLHTFQMYTMLESKFVAKSLRRQMKSSPLKNPPPSEFKLTNNQKCQCYKDMFISFIVLVDYKFNANFINTSQRFNFEEWHLAPMKPFISYFTSKTNRNLANCSLPEDEIVHLYLKTNINGQAMGSSGELATIRKIESEQEMVNKFLMNNQNALSSNLMNNSIRTNEMLIANSIDSNRFIYLLMINACFVFLSIFQRNWITNETWTSNANILHTMNTNNVNDLQQDDLLNSINNFVHLLASLNDQRSKFFDSFKEDYRLKNFFCLFKLTDSIYEKYFNPTTIANITSNTTTNEPQEENPNQDDVDQKNVPISLRHMSLSLNSIRSLFKSYLDEYVEEM